MAIQCSICTSPYPEVGTPFRCPQCGGVYDDPITSAWEQPVGTYLHEPGIWRYARNLGLPQDAPVVSLGEGNTPLVWSEIEGHQVGFKCEFTNPSGSYKDRGAAPLVSFLLQRGVKEAIEDSSGNAGAAFAAYSARAGIKARVYMPAYTFGPKANQIETYGAEVVRIPGSRQTVADETLRAAQNGITYASHAYLPYVIPGYATIAYEICEQMDGAPGSILVPVGQGSLLLGIGRGFLSLQKAGKIAKMPRIVGVQARACAPYLKMFNHPEFETVEIEEQDTLAEGVRICKPLRPKTVLGLVKQTQGLFIDVPEHQIYHGLKCLARLGFYVEPTSALVWGALVQILKNTPEPIVAILTGSGLKWNPMKEILLD